MASRRKGRKSKLVVRGEDIESEDEVTATATSRGRQGIVVNKAKATPVIAITNVDEGKSTRSSSGVKVVTFGEAPESDGEDEFGTNISLASVNSMEMDDAGVLNLDAEAAAVLAPIFPQRRSPRLDPSMIRKHRERNKSLRMNISEKFLTPVITTCTKKIDRLSQNLSNSQMQMQDALFQSRMATGNLLRLQKDLETFLEADYLKELKILPSDDDVPTSPTTASKEEKVNVSSSSS